MCLLYDADLRENWFSFSEMVIKRWDLRLPTLISKWWLVKMADWIHFFCVECNNMSWPDFCTLLIIFQKVSGIIMGFGWAQSNLSRRLWKNDDVHHHSQLGVWPPAWPLCCQSRKKESPKELTSLYFVLLVKTISSLQTRPGILSWQ